MAANRNRPDENAERREWIRAAYADGILTTDGAERLLKQLEEPALPVTPAETGRPNPDALAAVYARIAWFLEKREMDLRTKKLKGRNRAASISI